MNLFINGNKYRRAALNILDMYFVSFALCIHLFGVRKPGISGEDCLHMTASKIIKQVLRDHGTEDGTQDGQFIKNAS